MLPTLLVAALLGASAAKAQDNPWGNDPPAAPQPDTTTNPWTDPPPEPGPWGDPTPATPQPDASNDPWAGPQPTESESQDASVNKTDAIDKAPPVESPPQGDATAADPQPQTTPPASSPTQAAPTRWNRATAEYGYRLLPYGKTTGIDVNHASVVGADGGTHATSARARFSLGRFSVAVGIPYSSFSTADGNRSESLGNLRIDGSMVLHNHKLFTALGIETQWAVGGRAYTWTNDATALWPSYGITAVYQGRYHQTKSLTWMWRGALGIHGTSHDDDPYPAVFARIQLVGGIDYAIIKQVGVIGEMAFTYWDTSPWELSVLARFDPFDGFRLRAGFVFPLAVWAGATPQPTPAGVRETTLLLDLSLSLP